MAMLCAEHIGRESEIRTLMTAFDAAGCRRQVSPDDAVIRVLSCMDGDTGTLLVLEDLDLAYPETVVLVEHPPDDLADQHREQMVRASLGGQGIPSDALTRIVASCDELPLAVEGVLATAVSSGELVLDEAGCT
jgi:hypothetical protein